MTVDFSTLNNNAPMTCAVSSLIVKTKLSHCGVSYDSLQVSEESGMLKNFMNLRFSPTSANLSIISMFSDTIRM